MWLEKAVRLDKGQVRLHLDQQIDGHFVKQPQHLLVARLDLGSRLFDMFRRNTISQGDRALRVADDTPCLDQVWLV